MQQHQLQMRPSQLTTQSSQPSLQQQPAQNQIPSQQDWVDQVNQDPTIAELRQWLHEAARIPGPDEEGRPRQPSPITAYTLPNGDVISCIFWQGRHYITGTDIVKILLFRFHHIGRQVLNTKKFEEGVFSDLRNLKPGVDAVLEDPKSPFLEYLYKNNCIRTQKKQKVFFWYKVPHDALFRDAIERDLKREASLYQTVHLFNVNQRMMRAPAMTMLPVQLGSPGGTAGLHAIAPQPTTALIDPSAFFQYAALASPQMQPQLPLGGMQPQSVLKFGNNTGGTVDPNAIYSELSPLSAGPQPNSPLASRPSNQRDPMLMFDDPASSLLSEFGDPNGMTDTNAGPFNMDQFVNFTNNSESNVASPRDSTSGLTL